MSDPTDIPAWLRLSDRVTTSGQPNTAQLVKLRALGVEHVINLAPHSHERALPGEAASVTALGMRYVYIPVAFDAPTEADFAHFSAEMAALDGETVHVHCIVNARVSAFFYRYHRDVLGIDEPTARAMLTRIWRPGGVWAAFLGDTAAVGMPHRYGVA